MEQLKGNKYGTHRVIEPKGVLTQAAWKIDNDMTKRYSNEIICDVTSLNIDSASFTQIEEACGGDEKKIGDMILGIVAERGKQQNPVTGVGRSAFPMAAAAIVMGGNVRVGFEDNLNLARGVPAKSNGELVAKVVRLSRELGRDIASPAEARRILNLA